MAAPVVSGTVALMLQANPSLTPNAVKAILQYTAQVNDGYDPLTQGAGFLNSLGAVRLAGYYATAQPGQPYPVQQMWSKRLVWGNHLLTGGVLLPTQRLAPRHTWGVAKTDDGDNIVWGTAGRRRQHRLGHVCRRRQHRLGHVARRRQHRVGHGRRRRQHRLGHVGRRRQHRLGHGRRRRQHRLGHRLRQRRLRQHRLGAAAATTSCGARPVTATTSSGAPADGDNIVWGTDDGDNIVWGTGRRRQHRLGHRRQRDSVVGDFRRRHAGSRRQLERAHRRGGIRAARSGAGH